MKLCGCKRSLPRSFPDGDSLRVLPLLRLGSVESRPGSWFPAAGSRVHLRLGFTVGTVGIGPKAREEVFAPASAPGVLAPSPTGTTSRLVQQATLLLRSGVPYRVGRRRLRPVLKHGPRSLTCVQVTGLTKPYGEVKAKGCLSVSGMIPHGRNPAISNHPRMLGIRRAHTLGPERW